MSNFPSYKSTIHGFWLTFWLAGKDRTGVLAGLIHSLAGSSLEIITHDNLLTRIGIEPVREFLIAKLVGVNATPAELERFEQDREMQIYSSIP